MKMRCPFCGSADIRRSQMRGFIDGLWSIISRVPYRCRACNGRFHRVPPEEQVQSSAHDTPRRET